MNAKILRISDNNYIEMFERENKGNVFYDILFDNHGKEIFIGRYAQELGTINAIYNSGMILIYSASVDNKITRVYTLYDILDDTHYSSTELEALNLFDPNLDGSSLKTPHRLLIRSDIEKKHRLIKQ